LVNKALVDAFVRSVGDTLVSPNLLQLCNVASTTIRINIFFIVVVFKFFYEDVLEGYT
jgi:hypothetical protein